MKKLLRRIFKFFAYTGGGLVIVLAIAVGLFRLLLPKLPEYQENIKSWADAAIGMQVEFSSMNARWRLNGPELNFYDAVLTSPGSDEKLIEAREISVGVSLARLLVDRQLVVDRILVRQTTLEIGRSPDDDYSIQGIAVANIAGLLPAKADDAGDIDIIGQDITIRYQQEDVAATSFRIGLVEISREDEELRIEASLDLPDEFGRRLDVSVDQRIDRGQRGTAWQVFVDGRSLNLPSWSMLELVDMPILASGTADISLWMELTKDGLDKATANLVIDDLSVGDLERNAAIDLTGRIEYSRTDNGWLLAAENFSMQTAAGEWPESSIQVQFDPGAADNSIDEIVVSASYLKLDDFRYLLPWLPEKARSFYLDSSPSGEILDLKADIAGFDSTRERLDVSVQLVDAGFAAQGDLPGVRGFTGNLRANLAGGRLEFDSSNLRVSVPQYLVETMVFDDAIGTVIWRRSNDGIFVLSDSVRLRNADFDSQSSLQVNIPADGAAPIVDFESRWSINDLKSAKRFLPGKVLNPVLHRWLHDAFVSGTVTRGTTLLIGPLDKFPFANGEGQFRIDAHLEDAILRYAKNWPVAQLRSLDLVVDGTHLYSQQNSSVNAGNRVSNANMDIPDLLDPVLTIDAFATGTLESIRNFSRNSPIANVFGGQLENVRVAGDASFNLLLKYPLRDRANYDFNIRIQASDGSINVSGFPAPLTNLNGMLTVTRDSISSESLFGRFLGEQVDLEVKHAGEDMPANSVIVSVTGNMTAAGLKEELGIPLGEMISGSSDYRAKLLFPRAGQAEPVAFQISIASDLQGFAIDLPAPLAKAATEEMPVMALIELPGEGHVVSNGSLGDDLKWSLDFRHDGSKWDFDRGVLAAGGEYPALPDTRGLHIQGRTGEIHFNDWLDIATNGAGNGGQAGIGNRIRSVDLTIDNLYVFGQHFLDHRVVVDRSASEWLVQVDGSQAQGSVTIPYDLGGERPIVMDFDTLLLPGSDEPVEAAEVDDSDDSDPRNFAAISFNASEFALGERYLGEVEAEFLRTPDGLRATGLTATDESFEVKADVGWIVDPLSTNRTRTFLKGTLTSHDVRKTMQRLGYQPGIEGDDMEMDIDVNWLGGPREDFLDDLEGSVAIRLGPGQLFEVEPGAGRIFGLMSIVALPRRLSLDFSDVLDKGFGFDEIGGDFRIEGGNAYTCNLSLKGPAADIGIAGRAGLASRDYDQTAIVSVNVGNTLPIVGAVVAGPQVAAALLIFSQIFKKPLQEMGQIYYGIDGSFDDPLVDVAASEQFAASLALAECVITQE